MNEDNRNLLMFAMLALLIMIAWPSIMRIVSPSHAPTTANPVPTKTTNAEPNTAHNSGAEPAVDSATATRDRATVLATLNQRGVLTKLRDSAGQEVDGGCGQLRARASQSRASQLQRSTIPVNTA